MKKLLLINPVGPRKSGYMLSHFTTWAPVGLAYVAAATPADWDVRILDENFEQFRFEEADIVGMGTFTSRINRAYEIARMYRDRNIKVVLGGIHASMAPEEAMQHADAVVVGEVEDIWETVLRDFENNRLARKYVGPRVDFSAPSTTRPRHDLIDPRYVWDAVQTSRGCPFNCNFCSVSKYLGSEYRKRNPDDVMAELETVKTTWVSFVDDNLVGYKEEHKQVTVELFHRMIEKRLNKKWWMQTSINVADDERVVKLAGEAGCMFAFIGFETLDDETLKGMKKGINLKIGVKRYKHVVDTFHKYGIGVMGGFITGNDHESFPYYKQLADFMLDAGVDICQVSMLTPFPGTTFTEQIMKEDRMVCRNFPSDWDNFRMTYLVHDPVGTSPETIYTGNNYIKSKLYCFPTYPYRLLRSYYNLKGLDRFYAVYKMNEVLGKAWRNSHYFKRKPSLT